MEEPPTTTTADLPALLLFPLEPDIKVTADRERRRRRSCEIPELNLGDFRRRDEPAADFTRTVTSLEEPDADQEARRSESNSLLQQLAITAAVPCYFFMYGLCNKGDACSFSHATTTITDHVKPPLLSPLQPRQPSNNSSSSTANSDEESVPPVETSAANASGDDQHHQKPAGRGKDETMAGKENVVDGDGERNARMLKEMLLAHPLSSSGGKGFDRRGDLREHLRKRKAGDGDGCVVVVESSDFKGPKTLAQIKEEKRRRAEEQKGKAK